MNVEAPDLVVVKIGGDVVAESAICAALCADIAELCRRGHKTVIVHGGGPQATALAKRLGLVSTIIAGRRVTDRETLDVMKMTVAGIVNVDLVAALVGAGVRALGLCGASGSLVQAVKRPPRRVAGGGDDPIDFGHVGDIVSIDVDLLQDLLALSLVPVIACLGIDAKGNLYNINADIVATRVAAHLGAPRLFLFTGVCGVLRDVRDPTSRIERLSVNDARRAIADGSVSGGMLPKLEETFAALDAGVGEVVVLGGAQGRPLLSAIDAPGTVGTTIVP
ncbi:MAG: acetylglutamate kinase [Myxococcales bacterium]|nr:acetylglutamate kinase [Myxococcales bacterium]